MSLDKKFNYDRDHNVKAATSYDRADQLDNFTGNQLLMILLIDDSLTINDIQDRFQLCFPKLKIEFCKKHHHWEGVCSEKDIFPNDKPIGNIRRKHNPGMLEIKSWQKVGEIEKKFHEEFGLNAQIFYRSGQRWIQTGKSDNLTLKQLQDKSYTRIPTILL